VTHRNREVAKARYQEKGDQEKGEEERKKRKVGGRVYARAHNVVEPEVALSVIRFLVQYRKLSLDLLGRTLTLTVLPQTITLDMNRSFQ